jgi:hypothetical protein
MRFVLKLAIAFAPLFLTIKTINYWRYGESYKALTHFDRLSASPRTYSAREGNPKIVLLSPLIPLPQERGTRK